MTAEKQGAFKFADGNEEIGPVECLGYTFENDEARRTHFTEELRKALQDPKFRQTPGFPNASDREILRLSDPPYYTACPNPFFSSAASKLQTLKQDAASGTVPLAIEEPEKRHDPVGLAHTYHTKISHKTVLRLVEHYTKPGDMVLDCFSGSGMTGVATALADLGPNGEQRSCFMVDLCPSAALLSYCYTGLVPVEDFAEAAESILAALAAEFGDFYSYVFENKTYDAASVVWAEVYTCESCGGDVLPWDESKAKPTEGGVCRSCGAEYASFSSIPRQSETYFDPILGLGRQRTVRRPVLLQLRNRGSRRNLKVSPSSAKHVLDDAAWESSLRKARYDAVQIPYMHMTHERNNLPAIGVEYVHDLFSSRNFLLLRTLYEKILAAPRPTRYALWIWANSTVQKLSHLMCYNSDGIGRVMKGVYYVPRTGLEGNPLHYLKIALPDTKKFLAHMSKRGGARTFVSTSSATQLLVPDACFDYIFIDPPFGGFQLYSDLNFLWDSFVGAIANRDEEVIVDGVQGKGAEQYGALVLQAFRECYRVLKPGCWMTVKFHNSSSEIWALIQRALATSGFVVADVSMSDKRLGTTKQINDASTVRQDLIISAYRPVSNVSRTLRGQDESTDVWTVLREHLQMLPVYRQNSEGELESVRERQVHQLFNRMLAFYLARHITVPLSFANFAEDVAHKFVYRDEMFFLPEQVEEYDRARSKHGKPTQLELFIRDESSPIQWARAELNRRPQTLQSLTPEYLKQAGGEWAKHESAVELRKVLEENFLRFDGGPIPPQVVSYLRQSSRWRPVIDENGLEPDSTLVTSDEDLLRAARGLWYLPKPNSVGDIERRREQVLLREYRAYLESSKKLKQVRSEAVRAGFSAAWRERDYQSIVDLGRRLPGGLLLEDSALCLYFDNALTHLSNE